jgi:hypothetical protein
MLDRPDLTVTLDLDPYAPRAARHHVAQVDHPSPDLRDVVLLLTSEIVSRAVERADGEQIELRVWMPHELVRIEVHGPVHAIAATPEDDHGFGLMLVEEIADRWDVQDEDRRASIWFEIDRHPAEMAMAHASGPNVGDA